MSDPKTRPTDQDVTQWMASLQEERRRLEAPILDQLFQRATGFAPQIWQGGIVGYGTYDYTYASGHSGTSIATGFAPRKAKLSIYIMPGYTDFRPILQRLGKHTTGRACLYVNKLADIDQSVLTELIQAGLRDLATHWPVKPT